ADLRTRAGPCLRRPPDRPGAAAGHDLGGGARHPADRGHRRLLRSGGDLDRRGAALRFHRTEAARQAPARPRLPGADDRATRKAARVGRGDAALDVTRPDPAKRLPDPDLLRPWGRGHDPAPATARKASRTGTALLRSPG